MIKLVFQTEKHRSFYTNNIYTVAYTTMKVYMSEYQLFCKSNINITQTRFSNVKKVITWCTIEQQHRTIEGFERDYVKGSWPRVSWLCQEYWAVPFCPTLPQFRACSNSTITFCWNRFIQISAKVRPNVTIVRGRPSHYGLISPELASPIENFEFLYHRKCILVHFKIVLQWLFFSKATKYYFRTAQIWL